eukprot:gene27642-27915_t
MPDGEYMLGRHTVMKCMGGVRLADGTLAGSTLTMDQALRNLVGLGLDLADASARVSTNAADYLGLQERGRLAPGTYADLVVLDQALSAADCVALQLASDGDVYAELGRKLRSTSFSTALTIARGSSDHACAYAAYLIMARLGRVVASLPMSLVTLNKSPLITRDTLAISISQSGQSPDVVEPIKYFRDGGATTVALVNDIESPLAHAAEYAIPLRAGKEQSVAATKSFITSMVAG